MMHRMVVLLVQLLGLLMVLVLLLLLSVRVDGLPVQFVRF